MEDLLNHAWKAKLMDIQGIDSLGPFSALRTPRALERCLLPLCSPGCTIGQIRQWEYRPKTNHSVHLQVGQLGVMVASFFV